MTRKLLIVFASGMLLALLSLGAAWAIGGPEIVRHARETGGFSIMFDEDDDDRRPTESRTFTFDAARPLTVELPVELHFTRGDQVAMVVSGPINVIRALRWENGRLSSGSGRMIHGRGVHVSITAPQLAGLVLKGPGDVTLENLDQPAFALDASGAVDLDASGQVQTIDVATRGAGDVDLAAVTARDAKVRIAGVGDVDINASGTVDAEIAGVGHLTLHRKPAVLKSRTSGVGSIDHDY